MAEIHWSVWIGLGLFVAILSLFLGGHMQAFGWVGLAFIVWGIGKLTFVFVFKQRDPTVNVQPKQPVHTFVCPRCRFSVHAYDVFCRRCGNRLR